MSREKQSAAGGNGRRRAAPDEIWKRVKYFEWDGGTRVVASALPDELRLLESAGEPVPCINTCDDRLLEMSVLYMQLLVLPGRHA
ncbi:hypothetical protein MPH_13506, partial [Macrophomina phaseolina MS6]